MRRAQKAGGGGEERLASRSIAGLGWGVGGGLGQALVRALVLVILARLLDPRDFGVVAAGAAFISFASIFSQVGLGPAVVQRRDLRPEHVQSAHVASTVLGCVFYAVTLVASSSISRFFAMPELREVLLALGITFPILGATVVSEALLQRALQFKQLAIVDAASYAAGYLVVGVMCALLGLGLWSLVFANLIQGVVRWFLVRTLTRGSLDGKFEFAALRQLSEFGAGFSIARVANLIATQGDNLVIGKMLGAEVLGIYGRSYQLLMMPANLVGQSIDRVLFPAMAKVQGDVHRLRKGFLRGTSAVAAATLPLSVLCVMLADSIVLVLFGERWASVTEPFRWFAAVLLLRTAYKLSESLARATGAVFRRAWRQVVYALAVVIGAYLGSTLGLGSVAAFVSGAIAVNYLLMTQLSSSLLGLSAFEIVRAHLLGGVLAVGAGASGGIALIVTTSITRSPLAIVVAVVLAALVGMWVSFRMTPIRVRESELGWLLELVGPKLPRSVRIVVQGVTQLSCDRGDSAFGRATGSLD